MKTMTILSFHKVFPSCVSITPFLTLEHRSPAKCPLMAHILSPMKMETRPHVIAIADDDPRVRESLGELLESAGHSVRLFNSADAFLRADAVNDIDALISDIRMPGMDGVELQQRLAVMRPQLPVILITARSDVDLAGILQPNNRGLFRKPVDGAELIKAIETALKGMA
jgi:FixJ family two-component response regulator